LKARRDEAGPMVTIELEHLDLVKDEPLQISTRRSAGDAPQEADGMNYRDAVDEFSRKLVQRTLQQTQGNRAAAARQLGLDSGNFHRMVKRLGL